MWFPRCGLYSTPNSTQRVSTQRNANANPNANSTQLNATQRNATQCKRKCQPNPTQTQTQSSKSQSLHVNLSTMPTTMPTTTITPRRVIGNSTAYRGDFNGVNRNLVSSWEIPSTIGIFFP